MCFHVAHVWSGLCLGVKGVCPQDENEGGGLRVRRSALGDGEKHRGNRLLPSSLCCGEACSQGSGGRGGADTEQLTPGGGAGAPQLARGWHCAGSASGQQGGHCLQGQGCRQKDGVRGQVRQGRSSLRTSLQALVPRALTALTRGRWRSGTWEQGECILVAACCPPQRCQKISFPGGLSQKLLKGDLHQNEGVNQGGEGQGVWRAGTPVLERWPST